MSQTFRKIRRVRGELALPGDKSISHRAAIFAAMAKGTSKLRHLSDGEDVRSTIRCLEALGAEFAYDAEEIVVNGAGIRGFRKANAPLDAGNSGTTARLLSGLLVAQPFSTTIVGDESLSRRPMGRVVDPLEKTGATFKTAEGGRLPMTIAPPERLEPIDYRTPVASAQVKSAALIAGLHVDAETKVIEKKATRNHTETMLGLETRHDGDETIAFSSSAYYPDPKEYYAPADLSTAAFFLGLAAITPDADLLLRGVSCNVSRTAFLDAIQEMGADVRRENLRVAAGEPYADFVVKSGALRNVEIPDEATANLIDEIPILSVVGAFAENEFVVRGVEELRVKESDRIAAMCENFRRLGYEVEEYPDGFLVAGEPTTPSATLDSFGDHRVAMAFAILLSRLDGDAKIDNFDCVKISNPNFLRQLTTISE
jgi:3-phosphoshikimate 1-carboxyvinyltransferase